MDGDLPRSAALQGSAGLFSGYDVFRAFTNPALLTRQPRKFEVAATNALLFGGAEDAWAIAAGWAGPRTEKGSFAVGLMLTGMSIDEIKELNLFGYETGRVAAPSMIGGGLAVAYQWEFASFGAAMEINSWSLGDRFGDAIKGFEDVVNPGPTGHFGATLTLGLIDLGGYFRLGELSGLGLALGIRTGGALKGVLAADLFMPTNEPPTDTGQSSMSGPTTFNNPDKTNTTYGSLFGLGYTWEALKVVDLRFGIVKNGNGGEGSGPELRLGFGVPWKFLVFDYAFTMGDVAGNTASGVSHLATLRWTFGADRKAAEGPKFFLKAEERTLAVATFEPQGVSATDAAVISDMLRNRLIKEGSFNIVEKAYMDKILTEQAFQQTGCTSAECAVKIGKVLNVRYLVVGSFGKALDRYVLSMRVVDVESAKGVYSDEATGANLTEIQTGLDQISTRLTEAVKKAK